MTHSEPIRVLVADDIAETRDNIARLLGFEKDLTVVGAASGGNEAVALARSLRPDVILMDINMPDLDGIAATEIIANTVGTPIIMMSVQGEQDYLRRSMLAGAREFLVKPFSADELVNAIRHVHELEKAKRARYAQSAPAQPPTGGQAPAAPRARGEVFVFFSPKGGVGRTTIATNLAVALREVTGKPVALVDGSLPFGDVGVFLNVSHRAKTIADLIGSFETADADVLDSVLVEHATGIRVLLAPPTPESTELITGANMKHILETLRERYAYVVVDTWPSFQEQVLATLDAADVILTLMTLEITHLKNVKAFLDIVEKLGYDDGKVQLVANRNDSSGGIKLSDFETSLGRKIRHTIVSDGRTLVAAVNRGVPFFVSDRTKPVSADVVALAMKLSGGEPAAAAEPAKPAAKGGLRLFSR